MIDIFGIDALKFVHYRLQDNLRKIKHWYRT